MVISGPFSAPYPPDNQIPPGKKIVNKTTSNNLARVEKSGGIMGVERVPATQTMRVEKTKSPSLTQVEEFLQTNLAGRKPEKPNHNASCG